MFTKGNHINKLAVNKMRQFPFVILPFVIVITFYLISCQSNQKPERVQGIIKEDLKVDKETSDHAPLISRLIENTDGHIFFEDTTDFNTICSQELNYLGELYDEKDKTSFKILTALTEWGSICKVTSRILIYSNDEKYLGSYYTHGFLPTHILDNALIFEDEALGDFSNGIPDSLELGQHFWVRFEEISTD